MRRTPAAVVGTIVAGLVLAATLAAFAGEAWWGFDLLANFRVQLATLAAAVVMVSLLARRRWLAVVAGAALAVNAVLIAPLFLTRPEPVVGVDRITVVSFNVMAGNSTRGKAIQYLRNLDADVIFLHETSVGWEERILESDLPFAFTVTRPDSFIFGTTVLTRGAATVETVILGPAAVRSPVVTVAMGDRTVTVLGTHPYSPVTAERSATRDDHLRAVADWVAGQRGPVVVAGDLNSSRWSAGFGKLVAETGLVDSELGFGLQPTWPVAFWPARIPIDHVLHSADLTTVDRRLGNSVGSDHFPVVAELGWASS